MTGKHSPLVYRIRLRFLSLLLTVAWVQYGYLVLCSALYMYGSHSGLISF